MGAGTSARLRLVRDGKDQILTVKLAERPLRDRGDKADASPAPSERPKGDGDALLGLTVRDIDRQTAERLELPKQVQGVLIARVEPMSSSFDGGIERGTVLLEINRQHVESVADYRRIARAARAGDILALYVYAPDLPGLHTQGDSLEEATANAAEALALYVEGAREEGRPLGAGVIRRTLAIPA